MTENFGNSGDRAQEHGDQVAAGVDKAGNLIDEGAGAQPGAESGLEPGDTQTQPTTDASVQPEGGDYVETTSGGEYGSEPTETTRSRESAEGEQQY